MKQIIVNNNIELLVVEVPDDAYDFILDYSKDYGCCIHYIINPREADSFTEPFGKFIDNYKILNKLSDISETDCERLVKVWHSMTSGNKFYENYISSTEEFSTAKESLISLLQSEGFDTDKNLLLIIKE